MEKLERNDEPRGQAVERKIYEVSSKLKKHKELLRIVNISKLPDRGARLIKEIDELEKSLRTLNLQAETLEKDNSVFEKKNRNSSSDKNTCESNDNVAGQEKENVENYPEVQKGNKSLNFTSASQPNKQPDQITEGKKVTPDSAKENDHTVAESSKDYAQINFGLMKENKNSSEWNSEAISKHIMQTAAATGNKDFKKSTDHKSCMRPVVKQNHIITSSSADFISTCSREKKNQNSYKSNSGTNSKLNKQTFTMQNKTVKEPTFGSHFETELASFDQLSKAAPKSKDTLNDLVDSPSFKNWRHTNPIPGIKLTEAKPLLDSFPVYKCKSSYTTSFAGSLATEETVKKLHHSLCTYPDNAGEVEPPVSLVTPLLKHQISGLSWLIWRETQHPSGGILADDMGLGKTLTMISLILKQKEENNYFSENLDDSTFGTLIVCLASIVHQWKDEIIKHCEDNALTVLLYHGAKRGKDIEEMKKYDVVLTTYNIILSEKKSLKKEGKPTGLFELKWERVILDEAHTIKNYKSQTAEAVFSLNSCRRWCVTGTPIHNEFKDMYSLVKFLQFSPFDDQKKWKKLIDGEIVSSDKRRNLLVKSILLRRSKEDNDKSGKPLIKMVKKTINICSVELSKAEQLVYDELDSKIKEILTKMFCKPTKNLNTSNMLLVLLLRLQQCCCHIGLLGKEAEDETISNDSVQELSLNLRSLDIKDKPNVSENRSSEPSLDLSFSEYLNNDLCDPHVKSTKLQKLYEMIDGIAKNSKNKDKSIIVSQWVSLLDIVATHLQQVGVEYHIIAGSTKAEDRQKMSDDFNYNDDGCKIMLLSLKAGGVGLNLIGGSHMFLLDLHWNPALEKQACDRIHRVGQTKDVSIYKFVCKNTIEQRILELQQSKSSLANDILHGAGKLSKGLSMEDFKSLFNVRL